MRRTVAAAAANSLQLCTTLCDPIDGSLPGSPIPGILQARSLEWVAISFSNAWKWKVKVKSLGHVQLSATPWTAAYQAPPSMGFSRQEYWSGVPLPSPDEKNWVIGKDPDAGKDWRQEEKGTTEDEIGWMVSLTRWTWVWASSGSWWWTGKPGVLQSMGSLKVGHDWATSLSLFTFMHRRKKWQPTPMFLPGVSQGWRSLVGFRLWGRTELDTTEAT